MDLTGKEISYLHVCKRKLWMFSRGIRPELEFANVQIGMMIQEKTFSRHEKEIQLGNSGVLDWADFKDGVIHETKKGRSPASADEAQVAFYMWVLRQNGVEIREAQIHYPVIRKTKNVPWSEELRLAVENDIRSAETVIADPVPLPPERKNICKNCAYEEICFS